MKKFLREACAICIFFVMMLNTVGCSPKSNDGVSQPKGDKTVENNEENKTDSKKEDESPKPAIVRFAWWGGESRHNATVEAVEKFQDKYSHITVQAEYSGYDGYFDKLLTQFASKSAPDLIQLSYTNANEYVMRDQLYPLNDLMDGGILDVSELPKESLETYKIDGKYYAMPAGITASGYMLYNKDIFDEYEVPYPGEGFTWDDYFEVARKLTKDTDDDGETDLWGTSNIFAHEATFMKMLYERGGRLWSDDLTKVAYNSPEGVEVWTLAKQLLDEGIMVPPEISASNPPGVSDFASEQCALTIAIAPALYNDAKFNWGIAKLPRTADNDIQWIVPQMIYGMSNYSKSPNETGMLLDYLLNDEEAGAILKLERGAPANKKIRTSLESTLSETDKAMIAIIDDIAESSTFNLEPFPPGFPELVGIYVAELESVIYGKKTPEQALQDAETDGNKVLNKFYNEK